MRVIGNGGDKAGRGGRGKGEYSAARKAHGCVDCIDGIDGIEGVDCIDRVGCVITSPPVWSAWTVTRRADSVASRPAPLPS